MNVPPHKAVPAPPFRTNPSAIARYFFHDCQRFLRFHAAGPQRRLEEGIPTSQFDHSPLIKGILENGYLWEETVLQQLLDDVVVADGDGALHTRRFSWQQSRRLLREAEIGCHIYQPTLRLPRSFYRSFEIDLELVVISDNHPDLISVHDDGQGGRLLRVIDLKRGDSLELAHRVQILIYALELESILRAEGIKDARVDLRCGEVWLGSQPRPTAFDLRDFRPHLESFLRQDLTRVLRSAAADVSWHVTPRCEWCEYFTHCRGQMRAENNISQLASLTTYGKRFLQNELAIKSVSELGEFLQREDADAVLARCASLAGRGPRLTRQVEALASDLPQVHGGAALSLCKGENVALFITLQQEPLGQAAYLGGIYLTVRQDLRRTVFSADVADQFFAGQQSKPLVLVAASPDEVDSTRRRFVRLLHDVLTQVDAYNEGRDWSQQLSLQAYVYTQRERSLLVTWLLESLQDEAAPELAELATTLLFHFQAPELLVVDQHPDREVPFPVVVLSEALAQVLALPIEVAYTLPEALQVMGSRFQYARNDYFHFALGHDLRAEAVHAAWYRQKADRLPSIEKQVTAYLRALRELLQGVRRHAGDTVFAWATKFSLPTREAFPDPLLSRLAFFARYESLLACLAKRAARCEPHAVQLLLGKAMELRAESPTELEITAGAAMQIDASGFPEWLLVTDDEPGRRAQLEYRDYAWRVRLWQGQPQQHLAVVGVRQIRRDKLGTPNGITVEYAKEFAGGKAQPGQRLVLYPRFTDFTVDGLVDFLKHYDQAVGRRADHDLFLPILRAPTQASPPQLLSDSVQSFVHRFAQRASFTASQAAAFERICQRRVVPVWGPPGTGKTHFLAAAVIALAAAHRQAGRPFRVLVTAFTHAAIENLVRKIKLLSRVSADEPRGRQPQRTAGKAGGPVLQGPELAVAKVKSWFGHPEDGVEVVDEPQLPNWLRHHEWCVVGATTYSCLKKYDQLLSFDFVVIDEASQVRVPEAAIPISLVGPEGRLVLAGDHLQLPPIVNGVYPETLADQPTLHRSIFEAVVDDRQQRSATAANQLRGSGLPPADIAETGHPFAPAVNHLVSQLAENFRLNDVLTSYAAHLLYGESYRPVDQSVAGRRLDLLDERCFDPFVECCLDPHCPLVVVVLDGVWAARENLLEAQLVAKLVIGLRGTLRATEGKLFRDDAEFFRQGVFLVSPHRAQIRAIQRELRRQRMWEVPPFVDTVEKMQGQEADAVIVSYGVSDPEFAAQEADFIYGLNRLNVAITRGRSKCVVFLPRALLEASPQVMHSPEATRGLAFMRELLAAVSRGSAPRTFSLDDGAEATVFRTAECATIATQETAGEASDLSVAAEYVDDAPVAAAEELDEARTVRQEEPAADVAADTQADSKPFETPPKPFSPTEAMAGDADSPLVARPQPPSSLDSLNSQQRTAVEHGTAPLLIIAGAGTGKTMTLVHRVAYQLAGGVPPERLLLLTFTRRAAAEMLQRVAQLGPEQAAARRLWGGTFHGTAMRLLRDYGAAVGINPRFTVHDRSDSEDMLNVLAQELGVASDRKTFPKKSALAAIYSYTVNAQQPLEETLAQQFSAAAKFAQPLSQLFAEYACRKAALNVLDYDDLLVKWCELMEHAAAGDSVRDRFDQVLVDEYQDTSYLQARILRGLCPNGRGLTVVGDDAQSIYSFRAASIQNILRFPEQFPDTCVLALEQNYRSTLPILDASNRAIAESQEGYVKNLWSLRNEGPRPQLVSCADDREQVKFIIARIRQHQRAGIPLAHQAVLFRSGHHSILLEAELASHDIDFVKYGGLKFVESAHVKDALAILRLAENPLDLVAGGRALKLLPGIGPKKAEQLQRLLLESGSFEPWADAKPPAKAKVLWPQFVTLLNSLSQSRGNATPTPCEQVSAVLEFYRPLLDSLYDVPAPRLDDLRELVQLGTRFDTRAEMLAELAVDPPASSAAIPHEQQDEDCLVLSTIHSAKGLEWRVVYVLHATDDELPFVRAHANNGLLEEERRLLYVAMTRAADWLYVCYPERTSLSHRGSWYQDTYERLRLSRFISGEVQLAFQHQQASQFDLPRQVDLASPTARPSV